jgi:tRNA A-37 threonylcarbamoyl transferase component Bud32
MEQETHSTELWAVQEDNLYTLPVLAAHDYSLRWNDTAIQFETPTGMRHLLWTDAFRVEVSKPASGLLLSRTIEITDRGGKVHKISLADIPDKAGWLNLCATIKYHSGAEMIGCDESVYDEARDSVVTLWPNNDGNIDSKRLKNTISTVIILFACGWLVEFLFLLGAESADIAHGNMYMWFQFIKFLPLALIPLYTHSAPITQIRCTPLELRCESMMGGECRVKKRLPWISVESICLSPEKPKQRTLDRSICFVKKFGGTYKIKLEQIGTAQNLKNLLSAITYASGISVEDIDPKLLDQLNPDQKDPSYTQIWLDSLLAPPQREKLLPLMQGSSLQGGKFVLERKLGSGGQGSAYLARQDNGEMVVLKEYILPVYVDAKVRRKALENFENEAHMLEQLNSPLIVKMLSFFIEDHRGYLVLEHINGPNLRDYVNEHGPLAEEKAIQYCLALCDVLTHLHSQNPPIIHRDFTPDNVILCADDSIKVIDFMVAQKNDQSATGTVVGKHAYLPPEQFRGKSVLQSDIYALGCSLYFLLTGEDPEPLTTSNPILVRDTISGALDGVVAKATAIESADRYKSATEMRQALSKARALSGEAGHSSAT